MQKQNTTEITPCQNTPWKGWNLEAACAAFCKAFDCDDPLLASLRGAPFSPEEIAATEEALRLAARAAGVEPGWRCDWWSSREDGRE